MLSLLGICFWNLEVFTKITLVFRKHLTNIFLILVSSDKGNQETEIKENSEHKMLHIATQLFVTEDV